MDEFDLLERNMLKAIDASSTFHISEIVAVYKRCRSFDKTIKVLRIAVERAISTDDAFRLV